MWKPLFNYWWATGVVSALVIAQPAWAEATKVTGVELQPTDGSLEVILEIADGSLPQVFLPVLVELMWLTLSILS